MDMEYREAPSQESPTSTEDYTQEQKPVLGRRRRCHLYNSSSSWSWCDLIRNIFYSLLWILCLCSSAYSLWRVQILESELQLLREFLRISPSQVSILHITPLQLFQHENYIQQSILYKYPFYTRRKLINRYNPTNISFEVQINRTLKFTQIRHVSAQFNQKVKY